MFGLMDCNNFYVSCERVFRPDLNGKPVVVLSNNDGCVISRSNEAKKLNIPMGAPAFKFQELFEKNNVEVFSANFTLYGDLSSRVMTVLAEFIPELEIYSIDEAFFKINFLKTKNPENYLRKIRNAILKNTGIPVSIALAQTKALTKVAVEIAKKFPERTEGVYIIDTEEKRIKALKWLPIEDVWGIGRRHSKRLKEYGIFKAFDFTQLPDNWIKKYMSVLGLRLKKDLLGIPTLDLDEIANKKSIATTRTFETNYKNFELIRERIVTFAVICSEKLRQQNSTAAILTVFLLTNTYRQDLPQYYRNIVVHLPYPTNSAIELSKFAANALQKIFVDGYEYKKAGVIVSKIASENPRQLSIFDNSDPRHQKLMQTIDNINKSVGKYSIKLASQDLNRTWKMRQEKLSPRYTTKLDDIIKVKA